MAEIRGTEGADTLVAQTAYEDTLNGLGGDDTLNPTKVRGVTAFGGAGNDILHGGYQARLYGGAGDDTYYVYQFNLKYEIVATDLVFENDNEGYDVINTTVSYQLRSSHVEVLQAADPTSTNYMYLYGNNENNVIIGNAGNNELLGLGGNDVIVGGAGADTMWGDGYSDYGDDTFYVDNPGDAIIDGVGYERVFASVSYALGTAQIEELATIDASATDALNLAGNHHSQAIFGNAGINILHGNGGDDVLWGFSGNDYLFGDAGADTLSGGLGDDTYYVTDGSDTIVENEREGFDRVAASTSFFLTALPSIELLETITPSGTERIDLSGSGTDNRINGNEGVNILYGQGGSDTLYGYGGDDYLVGGTGADEMRGGTGNDTYYVDNSSDYVYEAASQGTDRIATTISLELSGVSEVETLEVENSASTAALVLTGSDFSNTIIGNAGNNVINGRGGSDILVGLGGSDVFQFTSPLGPNNVDRIEDFQVGVDRIALDDAVFTFANPGSLDPAYFRVGSAAQDADDRIIYDSATGALYYDADGNGSGAAVQFAQLAAGLSLSASDFMVI